MMLYSEDQFRREMEGDFVPQAEPRWERRTVGILPYRTQLVSTELVDELGMRRNGAEYLARCWEYLQARAMRALAPLLDGERTLIIRQRKSEITGSGRMMGGREISLCLEIECDQPFPQDVENALAKLQADGGAEAPDWRPPETLPEDFYSL